MTNLIIGAIRKDSGKTSILVGLAKAINKNIAYFKPFGNRLRYDKKRLWDYDAALMKYLFNLDEDPENLSLGFEHTRLKYAYDQKAIREKLISELAKISANKDVVFIEGGSYLSYGASIHLDVLSIAEYIKGKLIIIINGSEHDILDDIYFVKKYLDMKKSDFAGVIINKVADVDDFKNTYLDEIKALGVNVLGLIPYEKELTYFSVGFIVDYLFAKVIAGKEGLGKTVKDIFIGTMSATSAVQSSLFKRESKLVITTGDRSDLVLAALESSSAGIILTNNIMPPANIISKAEEVNIPLLIVPWDTYDLVKRITSMELLLTKSDSNKVELLQKLVSENVSLKGIV